MECLFYDAFRRLSVKTSKSWHLLTANIGMWKHHVFRFGGKRWYKPAEKNSRGESAQELRYYKAQHIGRPNPGKGVRERSCKRYRWIGKGDGSRKPVCAANFSPMIPEPTTAARRNAVPRHSATMRRERVIERNQFQEQQPGA
jgi:hypothetical protein